MRMLRSGIAALPIAAAIAIAGANGAAAATPYGDMEGCEFVNPNRLECFFLPLSASESLQIQYVSLECNSSPDFSLQQFEIGTVPGNGSSRVPYYRIPAVNQASVGGVVTAGSQVTLYAKAGTQPVVLIDLTPAPPQTTTECQVSLSGLLTP